MKDLVDALKQSGMTYGQIASAVGVKMAAIYRWRKNIVAPSKKHLRALKMLHAERTTDKPELGKA